MAMLVYQRLLVKPSNTLSSEKLAAKIPFEKWNLQPEQYQICQICDLPGPQTISTVIPFSDFPMVD
jgi:hypothetical protein